MLTPILNALPEKTRQRSANDAAAWRVFFAAIDLSPDDPCSNCPAGASLMPNVSSDNNFLEPFNFA